MTPCINRLFWGIFLGSFPALASAQDLDGTPASNKAQTEATRSGGGNGASSLYSPNLFDGSVDI
uniref:hypothetical protein n=1 Tax=Taibaiella koreensis TaxID=1268548 RepID=UPI0013C355D3